MKPVLISGPRFLLSSRTNSIPLHMIAQKRARYLIKLKNTIIVRFHEVDAYNIVHNVHYFNFFDVGRFSLVDHFLRREKAPEIGPYFFLVLKSSCKYVHPARMADELIIETTMHYSPDQQNAKIDLSHSIVKKKNNLLIVEGSTVLGICNEKLELLYRIPNTIRGYLDSQIEYYRANPQPLLKIVKS